ncbi:MAG: YigZ family protein [Oscillospiraceae bacterium]|jgi:uncharacterized YigZ family protein|nr:YigZ family protein [Oscillospiraceae bacterium]
MDEYYIPSGPGESEYEEKRSRFLGHLRPVETEEEARLFITEMKKKYHDARHNCWCYRIRGGAVRYSDDAEPQGTAGLPMLEILQREGIENAVCVVTRYFGGVLLGTGGLLRAYQKAAKGAVEDAGISVVRAWTKMSIVCDYSDYEKIRSELEQQNAVISDTEYGEKVTLTVLVSQGQGTLVTEKLQDRTAGKCICTEEGIVNQAVPT